MDQLCSICHVNQPKYTCPACNTRTCSLACVKRHKTQAQCTGVHDPTQYIPRTEFAQSDLNRDYNFLNKVDRSIQLGKGDVLSSAKNVFKRSTGAATQRQFKRFKGGDKREELVGKMFPDPKTSIKRKNTLVVHLPPGMARSNQNKTGYDKKMNSFIWTIEWIYLNDSQELARFISYRLKESLVLRDAVPMNIINSSGAVDKNELRFYLKNEIKKDTVIELNADGTLSDVLEDKILLEFATIYITVGEQLQDKVISEKEAYVDAEEPSSDESSSEGSSSDNDSSEESESESESESGSGSDSDSAPEESSSRLPQYTPFQNIQEEPTQQEQLETALNDVD
ncbi:uncharacterized protein SPAPADRAFT_60289 [Spathaspora passalidarum NRRL Y-27907]|uniref:HIT-type domain-containing protein n=1 Tax=Spathaspora passalidarum (strain NRRL Y-27907 / 11-Y1) TaxID=619300 RepID=G3AKP6_SPAPN|nr:uncharacterized protein SPAPADRAFT_60289 [Spathaspora passalidarum NRRL Y-27907]EGW32950.1 hypothetical protein SPAPADRAFT_60289 [Spathaspora passalidarum NRRL Y-27907]